MKSLRQVHLYLGCFFAPMLLYYSLSGTWQVFRFNDLPEPEERAPAAETAAPAPTLEIKIRTVLNEFSKPHKESTAPGKDPKTAHSAAFDWIAGAMGLGLFVTTLLGVALAIQTKPRRKSALVSLTAGMVLPILLLLLS